MVGTENTKSKSANFRQHCVPNTLRATKLCKRANVGELTEAYCHLQGIYSAELGTGAFIGVYLSHLRYSFIFLPTLLELYIRRLTKTKYIIKNVIYAKHLPWPYSHFGRYGKPGKPFVLLHFGAKKMFHKKRDSSRTAARADMMTVEWLTRLVAGRRDWCRRRLRRRRWANGTNIHRHRCASLCAASNWSCRSISRCESAPCPIHAAKRSAQRVPEKHVQATVSK